jgi:hypothetical protein
VLSGVFAGCNCLDSSRACGQNIVDKLSFFYANSTRLTGAIRGLVRVENEIEGLVRVLETMLLTRIMTTEDQHKTISVGCSSS